ncbi:hypothetical protein [Cellulomonas sp. KRMCY2]|uniref:hypothetical protein n=1 Tax=Cellulomonas sp. KRMCY2 TaxID=1304865 RepID=UPI00045EBF85|nr:hypothetical protein [Cellulomonas sp. KRMCY2]
MSESDGIEEAFEGTLRVAVTAAGRVGEELMRMREAQLARARISSEQEGRELAVRLDAERAGARAQLAPVRRDEWWAGADAQAIGAAYATAHAWAGIEPEADRAEQHIRTELRTRYGLDVDHAGGDPAAVNEAIAAGLRAEAQRLDRAASTAITEAHALMAQADRADRAAQDARGTVSPQHQADAMSQEIEQRAADKARAQDERDLAIAGRTFPTEEHREAFYDREPELAQSERQAAAEDSRAGAARERGATGYDSADRRRQMAADLDGKADAETINARVVADTGQARHPREAVDTKGGPATAGRRGRGATARQRQRPGLGR